MGWKIVSVVIPTIMKTNAPMTQLNTITLNGERLFLTHRKKILRRVIYMTNVSRWVLGLNYGSVRFFLFF